MTTLYAQPYDISATGFYFDSLEAYQVKAASNFNDCGLFVEEYELQFIDGDNIDAALFKALKINQCDFAQFLDACDTWNLHEKQKVEQLSFRFMEKLEQSGARLSQEFGKVQGKSIELDRH